MTKRKTLATAKQKEASKRNWTVFRLRGVIGLIGCRDMLNYSSDVQAQASITKDYLEDLLAMVKKENANHKHS